jgi:uncharacterized protein (DUF885 family)
MRRHLVALAALLLAFCAHAADVDTGQNQALHSLFDRQWEDSARRFPEGSTFRGDTRYNDRLSDQSPAAIEAADLQVRQWLADANAIPREGLSPADRVSLDLFIGQQERRVAEQAFPGYRSMRVSALGGVQADWAELMKVTPMRNRAQVQQLLRRMAAYPLQMDQEIALMRRGVALGWVPSKDVLDRVLAQIDGQLPADTGQSAFYEPFLRLGSDIPAADRIALQAAGRTWKARSFRQCASCVRSSPRRPFPTRPPTGRCATIRTASACTPWWCGSRRRRPFRPPRFMRSGCVSLAGCARRWKQ